MIPETTRRGGRRPRRGHAAILASLLLALAALAAVLSGCYQTKDETPVEADDGEPDETLYDYRLIESDFGVKRWILDSDRMEKFEDREDVELYGVRMQFFKDGVRHSTLTSERGRANLNSHNLFAWGNVVVLTEDGRRLETEELHYDNVSGRIHNDVFNRFLQGEEWLTGFGLEATPDLDYIEIKRQVEAEVDDQDTSGNGAP